jgi:hypothetical protein
MILIGNIEIVLRVELIPQKSILDDGDSCRVNVEVFRINTSVDLALAHQVGSNIYIGNKKLLY